MAGIVLKILNKEGMVLGCETGLDEVNLLYPKAYQEGDKILLDIEEINTLYYIQFDDARGKSLVYLTGRVEYNIPIVDDKSNLSPKTFVGEIHRLSVKKAFPEEKMNYRNLAENAWDQEGEGNCYPHASTNVGSVSKPIFSAQSAIDGEILSKRHDPWPYTSWSINRREDAVLRVDFGRKVEIDRLILYLRADFPHDSWWKQASVTFSDGSKEQIHLVKSGQAQSFSLYKENIMWLELSELMKADDPSPFPALTQIEVYGRG